VGNTLQKSFQGRGDKKRQGLWLKNGLGFLFLFFTYLGLLFELPVKRQLLWFILSFAAALFYSFFHIVKKEKNYSLEFLLSLALLIEGTAEAFAMPWLQTAYFPFLLCISAFYEQKTVLSVLLFIPLLDLGNLLRGASIIEEAAFISSLVVTAGLSLFLKRMAGRKVLNPRGFPAKEADAAVYSDPGQNSFNDGRIISDYLDIIFRPDEEIKDLLSVAKKAVLADSVHFFMSSGGILRLRCSTDEEADIIASQGGLLQICFEEKKYIVSPDMSEKKQEAGYLKKDRISSFVAAPVMDGNFPLGVVTADSIRVHAFSGADGDTMQMFAGQLTKILQRERLYPQIKRSYDTLKILNEESSKLLSSLNENVIVQNLIDGAHRIVPTETIFFTVKGRKVEILNGKDLSPRDGKTFNTKGTVLDIAAKNKSPIYISDVRNYRSPVLPFKMDGVSSVFLLPMFYESNLLGILALLLEMKSALSSYQIELLEVLGNQASVSIANARFHAEIERLAVTDGLTGLFNHRHFQERLADEFNRLGRFSAPVSLLLIDIDHFKKINDTYGHPIGDLVLKRVANIIRKTVRNIDIPARYGGEEFAVVLVGTDEKGAVNMGERLRKTVMDTKFESDGNTFNVTISIGISTYEGEAMKKEELVEKADKALYQAKGNGRNRSVLWSDVGLSKSI
jgi:diguanylate cyclase (GGDEF)-like protein